MIMLSEHCSVNAPLQEADALMENSERLLESFEEAKATVQ